MAVEKVTRLLRPVRTASGLRIRTSVSVARTWRSSQASRLAAGPGDGLEEGLAARPVLDPGGVGVEGF